MSTMSIRKHSVSAAPPPLLADLEIVLTEPRMLSSGPSRRPTATAQVAYASRAMDGTVTDGTIQGARREFDPLLGSLEADDLRWYLEEFPQWPFGLRRQRAEEIETALPSWGKALFDSALGAAGTSSANPGEPFDAWRRVKGVERRITVRVDHGATAELDASHHEAAARLLALPWELLNDGKRYLLENPYQACVRRQLLSDRVTVGAALEQCPLRVLFVMSRPDDTAFLDPRSSVEPVSDALRAFGNSVELTVLSEGSFRAMIHALEKASAAGRPYDIIHFDGHGVYDPKEHVGALLFEEDREVSSPSEPLRLAREVFADELGAAVSKFCIRVFVLDACQTAKTEKSPQASVAAALLRAGVPSVVAMSHSVLPLTTRRFAEAFYGALLEGHRVGTAMSLAQCALREKRARIKHVGGNQQGFDDWLVPVLFQATVGDPPVVLRAPRPNAVTLKVAGTRSTEAEGALPAPPPHTFVGRGREVLIIARQLEPSRHSICAIVLAGPGGYGKTALAAAAARFLLTLHRIERVAFASIEHVSDSRALITALGEQLVPGYTIAIAEGTSHGEERVHNALQAIDNALGDAPTLIVIDNLESALPSPDAEPSDDEHALWRAISHLSRAPNTCLLLTSRESVPADLLPGAKELRLDPLSRDDAIGLLTAVLRQKALVPRDEATSEQIATLIDAVGGHARSLVLLGEELASRGVVGTTENVVELMRSLEERWPGVRERSLIASVRLSLRRLPRDTQQKIRPLAVLHGPANLGVIARVLGIKTEEPLELCRQLVSVGLAVSDGSYLIMDPALGAALGDELSDDERSSAEIRWAEAMGEFLNFLYAQRLENVPVARHGTRMMLPDLFSLLETMVREVETGEEEPERALVCALDLEALVSAVGMLHAKRKVSRIRKALAARSQQWDRAQFMAECEEIEEKQEAGDFNGAVSMALALRDRVAAVARDLPGAEYDHAMACHLAGRALRLSGAAKLALEVSLDAQHRFAALAHDSKRAASMASIAFAEQAASLAALGRFDEAAAGYQARIHEAQRLGDLRGVAVAHLNLGNVRREQERPLDAKSAYMTALTIFEELGEPEAVARLWNNIGLACEATDDTGDLEFAEMAYRRALSHHVALGNRVGEAATLLNIGTHYANRGRAKEATKYYRQAAGFYNRLADRLHEGLALRCLGGALRQIHRTDEARAALEAAAQSEEGLSGAAEAWRTWVALADLEKDAGSPAAAARARARAVASYRASRAEGYGPQGRGSAVAMFIQILRGQGVEAARSLLVRAEFPPGTEAEKRALEALAAGRRELALADDPELHPTAAGELFFMLESRRRK